MGLGLSQICPTPGQNHRTQISERECHQRGTHTERQGDVSRVVSEKALGPARGGGRERAQSVRKSSCSGWWQRGH